MRHFKKALASLLLLSGGVLAQDASSTMAVPANYRQWVFLTSSLDLNYSAAATPDHHMLDNVFVDPASYQGFVKTGTWPDKTVMIKENRMAESAGTLSKSGQFQTGMMNLEIHVKDEARFPGKWAFFVSVDGKAAGRLMPQTASCYSCHQDHGAVDTTFVQFYPTLMTIAKDKGTLAAGYLKDVAAK
ncbi:MAG TPA: cytochrome P460 family protein [Rhizomicrobium sp.]|nr:cytochrome P460 family protein [Rhizomicrobium sp.]